MPTLYVTEPGAQVEKEYHHLLVTLNDQVLMRVPLARVSEVVLVGPVGVTTPALLSLLEAGVNLFLVSRTGQLRGRLVPPTPRNIPLRRRQYERAQDPVFCLEVARAIVKGKLRNQRTLARRICRQGKGDEAAVEELARALRQVDDAPDMESLRGLEGTGARAYFRVLRGALREEWAFDRRTRRPPGDPLNALLSLGYTLLTQSMMTALEVVGLDPYEGFFHADKYGRPALALDLVEEFRSIIVDSVVLTVVNKRILSPDDFRPGPEGGVVLSRSGLRDFLACYSARLETEVTHPTVGRRLTYRKCLEVQARVMREVIEGKRKTYLPFRAK